MYGCMYILNTLYHVANMLHFLEDEKSYVVITINDIYS